MFRVQPVIVLIVWIHQISVNRQTRPTRPTGAACGASIEGVCGPGKMNAQVEFVSLPAAAGPVGRLAVWTVGTAGG